MDLQLAGKTALVTGASRGIGRAIGLGLAREGVKVAVAARRVNLLEELAREIVSQRGAEPLVLEADLYQDGSAEKLAQAAEKGLGRIDILVNAAGGSRPYPFEATKEQWAEGILVNFIRLRELSHAVIPGMVARRWGRVINITGTSEPRGLNAANSAKAAVHAWAKGLSREMARHGITINSIQPGRIMSEQIVRFHPTDEDRRKFAAENIPMGRFGEPEELANLAVFLASPRAGYLTGTVTPVDGGMSRFAF
ncbi:MAG TPA: SDR family oxidoreductase [Burkholderiales bacterium]|jgi:3-oxoacyl-[acyl-carrier protein] reductase